MAKIETHEEAVTALKENKTALKAAKSELQAFDKSNKVKKGDDSKLDKKALKSRGKLSKMVENLTEKVTSLTATAKGLKSSPARVAKYTYPEGIAGDKNAEKRYRATVRSKSKRLGITTEEYLADPAKSDKALDDLKPAKKEKPEKKDKSEKKEKSGKKDKSEKKKKSKPAPAED